MLSPVALMGLRGSGGVETILVGVLQIHRPVLMPRGTVLFCRVVIDLGDFLWGLGAVCERR